MFKRSNVGVRIAKIHTEQMEKDEEAITLVVLSCEINPLTPELAQELHDFVRGTLYTMTGAEVNSLLARASFNLFIPPQAIACRMAPDQKKDSYTISEAKIGSIHAKRSKKSTAWTLRFTITCSPASATQLHQIVSSYLTTKYMTFTPAVAGLFDETPEVTSRGLSEAEQTGEVDEDLPIEDVDEAPATH